jgi:hypothetical protein
MGRQLRTKRAGEGTAFPVGTTATTKASIANYGITVIDAVTTAPYVLGAPSSGVEKTLVCLTTFSGTVVRTAPVGDTSIHLDSTGSYQVTFDSTAAQTITLIGINSTQWVVKSVWPTSGAAGVAIGTS